MVQAQVRRSRHGGVLLLASALALGGCSSGILTSSTIDDPVAGASAANLASLTDVVMRNPNDPQAYNMRGSVYGQSGLYKEAIQDFNRAISLDPKYAQAHANRGLVHRQINRLELALADYNRA